MFRRLFAANAAKLVSEWIEHDASDDDNVEFDVSMLDDADFDDVIGLAFVWQLYLWKE